MTRFAVDYLNDTITPNRAFQVTNAEIMGDRLARFHTYALSDDPRFYWNVSFEKQAISFRVRTPPGSAAVRGKWVYSEASNNPMHRFEPSGRLTPQDRIAFVEAAYHCIRPAVTHRTRFMLTVRGTDRGDPPPHANPPTQSDLAGSWQEVRIVPAVAGESPRNRIVGSLRLQNQGAGDAVASRVAVFLSRDQEVDPEDYFTGFADLPAVNAGSEQLVDLDLPFGRPQGFGWKYVIAVIDSSNDDYESNERNNLVVSEPQR